MKENIIDLMNPALKKLSEYHLEPKEVSIKLNQNENPFDWPESLKRKLADYVIKREFNRYPNFIPDKLKNKIAEYVGHNFTKDNIIVGNGSNEMLLNLLLSLTDKNSNVVICQPTFTVYNLLATGMGRCVHNVYLTKDLQYDVSSIISVLKQKKNSLLILCSPNNPTGTSLTKEDIEYILGIHKGFFILDQAYVEFGGYNAVELVRKYPNLIITRTFSKAFAAAGLRIGYMVGDTEILKEVNKIKLPYNINFFAEAAAMFFIDNKEYIKEKIDYLKEERKLVYTALKTMPIENIYPSDANFILVRIRKKDELFLYLEENDILVRDVSSYPMLENCLRITIGTDKENQKLIGVMKDFFGR